MTVVYPTLPTSTSVVAFNSSGWNTPTTAPASRARGLESLAYFAFRALFNRFLEMGSGPHPETIFSIALREITAVRKKFASSDWSENK